MCELKFDFDIEKILSTNENISAELSSNYPLDKMIDWNSFNLVDLYNAYEYLNGLIFDNELSKKGEILLKLKHLSKSTTLGYYSPKEHSITINIAYPLSWKNFLNLLTHEMIHSKIGRKADFLDGKINAHGKLFLAEMERINKKFAPIKVSVEADLEREEGKKVFGVCFETKNDKNVGVVKLKTFMY